MHGRVCALGITAHRARQVGAYQAGLNSRNRVGHVCRDIGEGTHMFNFFVKTPIGRCQVWEEAGSQLFGRSGEEFWLSTRGRGELKRQCQSVMAKRWDLMLLTISDKRAEWRLTAANPAHEEEDDWKDAESFEFNKADSARMEEMLEGLRRVEIKGETQEEEPAAVASRCCIQ